VRCGAVIFTVGSFEDAVDAPDATPDNPRMRTILPRTVNNLRDRIVRPFRAPPAPVVKQKRA
jgi:hypothetical protein